MNKETSGFEALRQHEEAYHGLLKQWQHAKSCIVASIDYAGVHDYRLLHKGGDEHDIRFNLFGAHCYVAFGHDLEKGWLEYGAVQGPVNDERYIPVKTLEFGPEGDLAAGCNLSNYAEFEPLHVRVLAEHAPELIRAYFTRE